MFYKYRTHDFYAVGIICKMQPESAEEIEHCPDISKVTVRISRVQDLVFTTHIHYSTYTFHKFYTKFKSKLNISLVKTSHPLGGVLK